MHEFEIRQEIAINAPRERVWRALTEEVGMWWAYRTGPENATLSLDARLGGHFAERWGEGDGAVWGVVTRTSAPEKLRLVGHLGMVGPGRNDYTYALAESGGATLLTLTHSGYGHSDPTVEQNYRVGWAGLLGRYLKAWVEEGMTHREVDHEPAVTQPPPSMEALELPLEWVV